MTREEIEREIAELEAANAAATSWGGAVGARGERIKGLRGKLATMTPVDPAGAEMDEAKPHDWLYTRTFQAIAHATNWRPNGTLGISVEKFAESFGPLKSWAQRAVAGAAPVARPPNADLELAAGWLDACGRSATRPGKLMLRRVAAWLRTLLTTPEPGRAETAVGWRDIAVKVVRDLLEECRIANVRDAESALREAIYRLSPPAPGATPAGTEATWRQADIDYIIQDAREFDGEGGFLHTEDELRETYCRFPPAALRAQPAPEPEAEAEVERLRDVRHRAAVSPVDDHGSSDEIGWTYKEFPCRDVDFLIDMANRFVAARVRAKGGQG